MSSGLPKHLPAEERRAASVKSVIDLAAKQNPSEITTTAIAERMGLTQGALFRHFPKKADILQAVMSWVTEKLLARVDKAAASAETPLAALEAVFMAHINFVAKHPGVPRMLFGELQQSGETLPKKMVQTLMKLLLGLSPALFPPEPDPLLIGELTVRHSASLGFVPFF